MFNHYFIDSQPTNMTMDISTDAAESFQVTRKSVTVQTESIELSVDKQDVSTDVTETSNNSK